MNQIIVVTDQESGDQLAIAVAHGWSINRVDTGWGILVYWLYKKHGEEKAD